MNGEWTSTEVKEPEIAPALSSQDSELGFFDLVNPLLRRWRLVVGLPLVVGVGATVVAVLLPPMYRATSTFMPEVRSQAALPPALGGLASQLGLALPQTGVSPRLYAQVARSRVVMARVLLGRYEVGRPGASVADSATLLSLLEVDGRNAEDSLEVAMEKLNEHLSLDVDIQTSIVSLSVEARNPVLAAEVANRFVGYLNEFNAKNRQSQARERRRFVEQRVTDAAADLRQAEEAVRTFYERNRGWQESPGLAFEESRLRRQVDITREVYLTLRREFETSRIEEVNDIPVITVIDRAVPPQQRSRPARVAIVVVAVVLATIVGCIAAVVADFWDRGRRGRDYEEFSSLVRGLVGRRRR